jgi:Uncharacterized protein conserved in bacteria (DUF2188)
MTAKQVWVSPSSEGWKVHSAGACRAAGFFDTKAEAFERGREIAINKEAELFVQNLDGTIGMRNSYGDDSFPPKG